MFKCPICRKEASDLTVNGRPRKTCGLRSCIKALKSNRGEMADFHCKWCGKTKLVFIRSNRETCGEKKCVNKYSNNRRAENYRLENPEVKAREKPNEIDLIPKAELEKYYPTFFSLVRVNKPKLVKCLRGPRTFIGSSSHRLCFDCSDIRVGALALI